MDHFQIRCLVCLVGIRVRFNGDEQEHTVFKMNASTLLINLPPKSSENAILRLKILRDEYNETTGNDFFKILYKGTFKYISSNGKREIFVLRMNEWNSF